MVTTRETIAALWVIVRKLTGHKNNNNLPTTVRRDCEVPRKVKLNRAELFTIFTSTSSEITHLASKHRYHFPF